MTFNTIHPADGNIIATYEYLSEDKLEVALGRSADAFASWKNTIAAERRKLCLNIADLLEKNLDKFADLITTEMGKPMSESRAEVSKCRTLCLYYADISEEALQPKHLESDFAKSYVRFDPLGAVFGIMPWNFPFWQVLRYAIPTMMAGNAVLLKHAPNTTACGLSIQGLFEEAGAPKGVFQTLIIDIPQVEQVIAHPIVQGVTLTGSERAGSSVAALAGKYLKKSVMELGGSDPFIVFEDADLEQAVKVGVKSRMLNTGQVCIAAKRFIVSETIKEKFLGLMKKEIQSLKSGDLFNEETQLGYLARQDLANKLETQVAASIRMGASNLLESERNGNFYSPALLTEVDLDSPACKEEIFGPVAVVISFKNETELLHIANNTNYGLGAAIWTKNIEKAEQLAGKLEAGCIAINDMVKSDPRLPFGGVKRSGYGRELSFFGLHEFVNIKTVYVGA